MPNNTFTQGQQITYAPGQNGIVNYDVNTGQQLGVGQSTVFNPSVNTSIPTLIPSGSLGSTPNLKLNPAPNFNNNAANSFVQGVSSTTPSVQDYIASLTPNPALATPEQQQSQSLTDRLGSLLGMNTGKTAALQSAENVNGVPQLQKDIADLSGLVGTKTAEYQAQQAALGTSPMSFAARSGYEQSINNAKASEVGLYQAQILAKTGQLTNAQSMAQRAVDLQYAPILEEIEAKQAQLKLLEPTLTKQEKIQSAAQAKVLKDQADKVADKKENAKSLQTMVLNATSLEAPADLVARASQAKTPLEAAQILGKYSGDYLKNEMLKEQIKTEKTQRNLINANIGKINADTAKTNTERNLLLNPTSTTGGSSNPIIQTILGSAKFTKDQANAITNAINNGEDPATVIKNQAKNIMGQTEATTVTKFEAAKNSLTDLQTNLAAYYAKGGNTNVFSGNYEKTINKLGTVSNPDLVDLATQIQAQLQIYRNAVSGTAYSEQEGKDINAIFPGINKTQGLNNAILQGRMKAFDSAIDGTYRAVLGNSYDSIKNATGPSKFEVAGGNVSNTPIPGTKYLSTTPTGALNFNIPKTN